MGRLLDIARAVIAGQDDVVSAASPPEVFTFSPPGGDWNADREHSWKAFQANAGIVLAAPKWQRDGLIYLYRAEATRRYGATTAETMACSLRGWIEKRAVH